MLLRRLKSDAEWALFFAELAVLGAIGCAIAGKAVAKFAISAWLEGGFGWSR